VLIESLLRHAGIDMETLTVLYLTMCVAATHVSDNIFCTCIEECT
jgi:hypothetical protein